MRLKIYKPLLLFAAALLSVPYLSIAQDVSVSISSSSKCSGSVKAKFNEKDFRAKMDDFSKNLKADLQDLGKNLSLSLNQAVPKISAEITGLVKDFNADISISSPDEDNRPADQDNSENTVQSRSNAEKVKTYSKSYPVDGNDRIMLSNQFGKITVNTWDRHEVKVDVQIKAESNSDDDAQSLLDGVQIADSKNGDQISFRTDIERNNRSWRIWSWGGNNKVRKITINYMVYMPAKTDLNVEQSYGAIVLPDLAGRVKLSSAYGSVVLQQLSNPANVIEGSYGSLKAGAINGARLEFAYGSVDLEECTNLKADLSYGSFKMGRLRGSATLNLANVSGVRIGELTNSFSKLSINSAYSAVALNVSDSNSFDFDITTTYGGFRYNDSKVNITSKTPADGSSYFSNTKNYKGRFGKGGDAQVTIRSSYGGVSFE